MNYSIKLVVVILLLSVKTFAGIDNVHLVKGPAIAKDDKMRSFGIAGFNDQHVFVLWYNNKGEREGRFVEAFDRKTLKSVYSKKLDFADKKTRVYGVIDGQKLMLVYGLVDPKDKKSKICASEVDDKGVFGQQKVLMTEGDGESDLLRFTIHYDYLAKRVMIIANQAQNNNITKHRTPRIEIYDTGLNLITKVATDKTEKPLDQINTAMLDGAGNSYFSVSHANGTSSFYILKSGSPNLQVTESPGNFIKDKNGVMYSVSKSDNDEKFRVIRFSKSGEKEADQESSFSINSDGTKPKAGKAAKAYSGFYCFNVLVNNDGTTSLVWKIQGAGATSTIYKDIHIITLDNNLKPMGTSPGWINISQGFTCYFYDHNGGSISLTDGKDVYMVYNTDIDNIGKTEKLHEITSTDIYKGDAVTCIAKMNGEKVYEQKIFVEKGANKYSLIQPGFMPTVTLAPSPIYNTLYYIYPPDYTLKISDKEVYSVLNTNGDLSLVKITLD